MRVDADDGMMKACCRDDKMCVIGSERGYGWGKVDQNRTCYSIMSRIFLLMIELIRTIIGNSVLRPAMGVRIDIA